MEAGGGAFDHLAIDAAGFGADDLGDHDQLFVHLEHAARDEDFGAGEVPDLGGGVGGDGAGQAQLLLAQDLLEFGALDGDDLRLCREVRVDERGDFRPEVAHRLVLGLEVEDGDGEDVGWCRRGPAAPLLRAAGQRRS